MLFPRVADQQQERVSFYPSSLSTRPPPHQGGRTCGTCAQGRGRVSPRPPPTPLFTRPRLIDTQRPPPERRPLQPGNGGLGLGRVRHLDEAKAVRPAGVAVGHHPDGVDGPIRFEQLAQLCFGRRVREIPHKDIHALYPHGRSLLEVSTPLIARLDAQESSIYALAFTPAAALFVVVCDRLSSPPGGAVRSTSMPRTIMTSA